MAIGMNLGELENVIRAAGGQKQVVEYAPVLIQKINRLEETGNYGQLINQLRASKEQGDFRGRILEVNFADRFIEEGAELQYGAKQGGSGDVDFCWCVNGLSVFIEMKMLGESRDSKEDVSAQLERMGRYAASIPDDTDDIFRIQRDIFIKSSKNKFNQEPKQDWINLVAVDVTELQLGSVDIADCILAVGGNELLAGSQQEAFQRSNVVGVFESPKRELSKTQNEWLQRWDVYRGKTPGGQEVYLKLTVIDDVLIVSFKEL